MKKSCSVFGVVFLFFASLVFFNSILSCEVGLGDSVDTQAPVISITYPPSGAIIRDTFVLAGTCQDDKGVASMEVVVKNNETQTSVTYKNVSIDKKTWKISLNSFKDGKWDFKDGKYSVDVTAKDSSGRKSGISSRSFEIDNTAPVFFVSSPNNTQMTNASKYGSVFKVNGTITEDHEVKTMEVTVFDSSKNSLVAWNQQNVEITGGTSVTFAKYDESNTTKETHTRYTSIYTAPDSNGNQSYYCSVRLVDSAKVYSHPVYTDDVVENNTTGNETTSLWLNDTIRDNLMSAASSAIANLEPSDIKSIWNGTYDKNVISAEKQAEVLEFLQANVLDTSAEGQQQLAFTLNKNASPKYEFIGYGFTGTDVGSHKSSKSASVGFNAVSGLNNTTFYPKTLKVIFFGPFEKSEITAELIARIYSDPVSQLIVYEKSDQAVCLKDFNVEQAGSGSVTSFTADVTLPDNVESGKYYLLAASGVDTEGFDFVTNNQFYGFLGQASGTAPELILSLPVEDTLSNVDSSLIYTGTSRSTESNIAGVSYEVTVYDLMNNDEENNPLVVGTITGSGVPSDGAFDSHNETWRFDLKNGVQTKQNGYTSCLPLDGNLYKYSAKITTTDVPGLSSTASRTVTIDKKIPVINKVSVSPVAVNADVDEVIVSKINGKVTFSGSVTERNPMLSVLTVSDGTNSKNYSFGDNTSFEQVIDTRDFEDGKNLTFKLVSTDKASNKVSDTSLIFAVDQSTDIPEISSTGTLKDSQTVTSWTEVTSERNMFGSKSNNIFNVTVSDDDGLDVVYLKVTDKNGSLILGDGVTSGYTRTFSTNKAKSYAVNYTVPSVQGNYKVVVKAVDSEFKKEKESSYFIGVYDNKMLMKITQAFRGGSDTVISLANNEVVVASAKPIDLKGTLSITSKDHISSIKLYKMAYDSEGKTWNKNGGPIADYINARTDDKPDTISVTGTTGSVSWANTINASYVVSGTREQHFVYEAADIYGNVAETELVCFVDDGSPDVKFANPSWSNSKSQEIKVWVSDTGIYKSGMDSVKYSFKADAAENQRIALNQGQRCDENGNVSASTKNWIVYSLDEVNFAADGASENTVSANGVTKIYVWATDAVGNTSAPKEISFKIDTAKPVSSFASMTENLVLKTSQSFDVDYAFADEKASSDLSGTLTSGIKNIEISADKTYVLKNLVLDSAVSVAGTADEPMTVSDVPLSYQSGDTLTSLSDGGHDIYVRAFDDAGNVSEYIPVGSLIVDTVAPVVTITSGVGKVLNKKVQIGGSVNDANVAAGSVPSVYWSADGSAWTKLNLKDADSDGKLSACDGTNWTADIDTTDINSAPSAKKGYIYASFTDMAGNVNGTPSSAGIQSALLSKNCAYITIDQNSDRPEIKLSNIKTKVTYNASSIIEDPNSINTSIVSGTISDDDGVVDSTGAVALKMYRTYTKTVVSGSGSLTPLEVEQEIPVLADGSWSVTMDSKTEKEGLNSWKFRVVDVNGTQFTTGAASKLSQNYVTSKLDATVYDDSTPITFCYDVTAPSFSVLIGKGSQTAVETSGGYEVWDSESSNLVLGGKDNSIWVSCDITEVVGLGSASDSVVLTLKGKALDGSTKEVFVNGTWKESSDGNTLHTYRFYGNESSKTAVSKLSDFADGSLQIIISARDAAGNFAQAFRNVTIDTEAPQVQIVSPTASMSDAVSSAISVKGLVQDDGGSSIKSVKYMIPDWDQHDYVSEGKIPRNGWKALSTSASWEITFASGSNESSDSLIYYATAKSEVATPNGFIYCVEELGEGTGIYKVPFYFLVEDNAGNSSVRTTDFKGNELYVLVDSEGGKPTAWISSPEENATTSGQVTVYGGASDNVSIKKVQLKINDGEIVDVTGTNSWKHTVDSSSNYLTKIVDGKTINYMTLSVRAFDDDNQTRAWTKPVEIIIDGETPTIKNVKLVQKKTSSGSVNVEREYVSGMYISDKSIETNGDWYLTADVADNVKVSRISWMKMSSSGQTMIDINPVDVSPDAATYKINQKLDISGQSGQIYYVLKVKDSDNGEQTQTVIINVDSTAPSFYDTDNAEKQNPAGGKLRLKSKADGKMLGTASSNASVLNNNGFFTFGDIVSESGSGLQYIAFYFKHNGSTASTSGIYNPMYSMGSSLLNRTQISTSKYNGAVYINSDELPALYLTGAIRPADNVIRHSALKNNKNIRAGGLVKAGGVYSKILSVDEENGEITISPTVSTSFTVVEAIYAQVVDHMLTESIDSDMVGIINDDNDGMCESISQIGSSYNWTASIPSQNILDGPVDIYAVAIDNAGNVSHGYVSTNVTNNRPRLTKVLLATDLNGSGKYDFNADNAKQIVTSVDSEKATANGKSFGEFSYYSAINPISGMSQSDVQLASESFKVISGLAVVPEFVGGNGEIGYILTQSDSSDSADYKNYKSGNVVSLASKSVLLSSTTNKGSYALSEQVSEKGGVIINPTKPYVSFTFWDKTDGTVQGTTSQWAHLMIPVTLMTSEINKPLAKISPFHWTDDKDNSVFIDEKISGHVELEEHWKALNPDGSKATSYDGLSSGTQYDGDPKVSGKVKIQGTVYDDVRLSSISANVFEVNYALSTYTNGKWSAYTPSSGSIVRSFTIDQDEISQDGHRVTYTMVVDTENLPAVTGIDQIVRISAKDWKNNSSLTSLVQTASGAETSCYRMDVVPYVTEIWTGLSEYSKANASVYSRTGIGNFPVRVGETIKVYGWNFGSSAKVTVPVSGDSTTVLTLSPSAKGSAQASDVNTVCGSKYISLDVGEDFASGGISVTSAGIKNLNNCNNDDAQYNKLSNGVNNDLLTDTMKIDVWNFKVAASPVGSAASYVHMKVGPYLGETVNSGRIGFSFKNAIGYFNMPGHRAEEGSGSGVKLYLPVAWANYYVWLWDSNSHNTNSGSYPGTVTVKALANDVIESYSGSNYYVVDWSDEAALKFKVASSSSTIMDNKTISQSGVYVASSSAVTRVGDYSYVSSAVPKTTVMSQTRMGSNFGGFNYGNFAFDQNGEAYGVAQSPDTSGTNGVSANFQFFSRSVGDAVGSLNLNYKNVINARRIENTSYYKGSTIFTDEFRVQNPEVDTYVSGETTYVYVAYYDHGLGQVKFRIGSVGSSANDIGMGLQDLNKATANVDDGSQDGGKIGHSCKVFDSTSASYVGDKGNAYKYVSVLESSSTSPYVAVGALKNNGTAVVAWYDSADSSLKLKYAAFSSVTSTNVSWSAEKTVSTVGGKYVSLACDEEGGMHFAYVSNSGADLYYTYMASPTATPYTVLVDSYQDVGDRCQITVGRESVASPWIPYISYKSNYASHTKIAYPVSFTAKTSSGRPLAGADEREKFTANWNVSLVPASGASIEDTVSVGVLKDWTTTGSSAGVMYNFPEGETVSVADKGTYSICNGTIVYGNGTRNPVVGYAVDEGFIELAQKR